MVSCTHNAQPPRSPISKIELRDVQGLTGGRDIWFYADGRLIVQIVEPGNGGLVAKRYQTELPSDAFTLVKALCEAHHFLELNIPLRNGVPDEARPTITVWTASGQTHSVAKWGNDRHADFDAIYEQLLTLVGRAQAERPEFEGPYDWKWTPEGG